jgi:hypothetical protein
MTHDWVDARGFERWLKSEGVSSLTDVGLSGNKWTGEKERGCVSVWRVDGVVARIGMHISDVPDELWVGEPGTAPTKGHPGRPPELAPA